MSIWSFRTKMGVGSYYTKAKALVTGTSNKLGEWLIEYAVFLCGLAQLLLRTLVTISHVTCALCDLLNLIQQGVTCTATQAWGQDASLGAAEPTLPCTSCCSYISGQGILNRPGQLKPISVTRCWSVLGFPRLKLASSLSQRCLPGKFNMVSCDKNIVLLCCRCVPFCGHSIIVNWFPVTVTRRTSWPSGSTHQWRA